MNAGSQFAAARETFPDLQFQAVFEGAAIGIAICRLDGRILEANSGFSKMFGYGQKELLDEDIPELYAELQQKKCRDNGYAGLPVNESVVGNAMLALIRGERASVESERRYRRKDGSAFWGHMTLSVARDEGGHAAFLIAMLADDSERKQMQEHLREAEKMEVIGRLAGGIAHDFNNLLTGILLYCDLLSAGLENIGTRKSKSAIGMELRSANIKRASDELSRHVEEVRRAGEQGAALTQQLLAIARKQSAEPRPIAINETIASTENLLRRLIGEQIELVVSCDSRLDSAIGLVLADPAQLRQVLLNLVLNARDAMPQGGKISLNTRLVEIPERSFDHSSEVSSEVSPDHAPIHFAGNGDRGSRPEGARSAIALAVTDNGCGMNEETRARLFEPFFTTKREGEGTGLGLATVQRIVNELGGTIMVDSEVGRGTCMEVFFPTIKVSAEVSAEVSARVSAEVSAISTSAATASLLAAKHATKHETKHETGTETILLVDDHASARRSMQCLLRGAGYRIIEASSAQQAIQLFAEQANTPDLMIADFMMPGMSGPELAAALRRQKPDLKILLVSGYEEASVGPAGRPLELIRKPFSGKALIDRVGEVMHRQAG